MIPNPRGLRRWAAIMVVMLPLAQGLPWAAAGLTLVVSSEAQARAGSSRGYSRPAVRTPSTRAPASGGDLALSRRGSAEALQRYRNTQRPSVAPPADITTGRRGWTPPPYAAPVPGLGLGQALGLWFLLDTLNRPGHASYFRDHRDDPDYRDWRREADQRAANDPQLRAKLSQLDENLAQPAPSPKPTSFPILPVAILGGTLLVLWQARRKLAKQPPGMAASPFRLGMTIRVDPTPFVLAQGATKVKPPAGPVNSATAIGQLPPLDRLYVADGFFQLHRNGKTVDECRWFSPLDQFTPADEAEWGFWLDPAQGAIGGPSFQTKDGKIYQRVWQPGDRPIPPRLFTETIRTISGTTTRRLSVMLYGAPLGLPPPAPTTEYVLLAMVEADPQAWVEIHVGLDVNPAALSL